MKISKKSINLKNEIIKTKSEKAITLVALVVTIIVLLVLAGVAISLSIGNNGIISRGELSVEGNKLASYKEKLEMYKAEKIIENETFLAETLSAGKNTLEYNTKKEIGGTILNIIPELDERYIDKLEIIKGELFFTSTDKKEVQAAKIAGIEFNPYKIEDGVLESADTNLELMSPDGTLTIPSNVTKIGSGAFSGLEGLKRVIIPGTVKEIASEAFSYNSTLEEVIIMDGVEKIGERAFAASNKISTIILPESITEIGTEAFRDTNIVEITIPSKVKELKNGTFANCVKLTKVKLKEGLETIGANTFGNCTNLENIVIPNTIVTLKEGLFGGCNKLTNITINNDLYVYESGLLMPKNRETVLYISKTYIESEDTFSIPEGIKNFKISLSEYKNIKTINIPKSLENLNRGMFPPSIENVNIAEGNTRFSVENKQLYEGNILVLSFTQTENIKFKEGINRIGVGAFRPEKIAKIIELPDTVLAIENSAFVMETNTLEKIKIGKNVTFIGSRAFINTPHAKVEIDNENKKFQIENEVLYSDNKTVLVCPLYKISGKFKVIDTVKEIAEYAFYEQREMTELELSKNTEVLKDGFLLRCNKITKIEIPNTIKEINAKCFNECMNLAQVIIHKKKGEIANAPWGISKGERVIKYDE